MIAMAKGPRGEQSVLVHSMKNSIVRDLQPKDYLGELLAIRNFATEYIRYSNDALGVEQVQDPQRLCEQIRDYGRAVGDCFPENTLLLTEGHRLIPVEELEPGQRIWGLDKWVQVEAVAYKGTLPIDVLRLNNGSDLKLTADHHVYVLTCSRHKHGSHNCTHKSCPIEGRKKERIRVSEVTTGMILTMPERLPFGTESMDAERAYVEGLFVADGWVDTQGGYVNRFSISGQDGCEKEDQKREVETIAERLGLPSRWHRKYITINDKEWALRMQRMGHRAYNKHLLSINLDETSAVQTLRGVMADSGANTRGNGRTFTTTSRLLAIQVRVLHKMFGISASYRYIENHGGLGEHPIWRISTRGGRTSDGRAEKLLRVKRIDREVAAVPCWDIQTEDHHVYLPEHDVTVSQCDDLALWIGTMCRQLGRDTQFVIVGFERPGHYSHVFARAKEPKSGQWIVLDPVAGTNEGSMLRRVTTYQIYPID
jgi:hypothetical protein